MLINVFYIFYIFCCTEPWSSLHWCHGLEKWSAWWVGKWLPGCPQRVVVNSCFQTDSLSHVGSPREPCGVTCCLISSKIIWVMGSNVLWLHLLIIPNWVGKGTLQKGVAPWRRIWIGWKKGLARTSWNLTRTSINSCA